MTSPANVIPAPELPSFSKEQLVSACGSLLPGTHNGDRGCVGSGNGEPISGSVANTRTREKGNAQNAAAQFRDIFLFEFHKSRQVVESAIAQDGTSDGNFFCEAFRHPMNLPEAKQHRGSVASSPTGRSPQKIFAIPNLGRNTYRWPLCRATDAPVARRIPPSTSYHRPPMSIQPPRRARCPLFIA